MKAYGWSEDYVLWELDGAKGWVFYHRDVIAEAAVEGVKLELVGKGYIQQEKDRIKESSGGENISRAQAQA